MAAPKLEHVVETCLKTEVQDRIEERAPDYDLVANGIKDELDVSKQVELVEQMIAQKADAIVIATGLIVSAYLVNSKRPRLIVEQPSAAFIRASGKCAECHRNLQYSIVHEFEMSRHAEKGVTCLDCHQVAQGQTGTNHNSFVISTKLTAANCRSCHEIIYQQFLHSRHAAASWAAESSSCRAR